MGTYYCVQTSLRGLGPAQGGSQGSFGSTIRSTSLWHENATRPIRTDGTTNGTTKILRRPTPGHETRRCTPLGPTRPKAHATQLWWRIPNGPWWSKTSKQQNDGRTSHGTQPHGYAHEHGQHGRHGSSPPRHASQRSCPGRC